MELARALASAACALTSVCVVCLVQAVGLGVRVAVSVQHSVSLLYMQLHNVASISPILMSVFQCAPVFLFQILERSQQPFSGTPFG